MTDAPARLFFAVEIDAAMRAEVKRFVDAIRPALRGWRFARVDGLHLTLRFLGDTARELLPVLASEARDAVARFAPMRLALAPWGVFPKPERPRVLWLGWSGDLEELAALATALDACARRAGSAADGRVFHPHLTIARAQREGRPSLPDQSLSGPAPLALEIREVVLFESFLGPGGAVHEPRARLQLLGATP